MGNRRLVVAIPLWLYVIGVCLGAVLWTGIVVAVLALACFAFLIYLLIALIAWIARRIRESNRP